MAQQVQIECRRHPKCIIICGVEDGFVLDQIHANQQAAILQRKLHASGAETPAPGPARNYRSTNRHKKTRAELARTDAGKFSPAEKSMPSPVISISGKRCCTCASASRMKSAEMSIGTYCAGCNAGNRRAAFAQLPAPRSISVTPAPTDCAISLHVLVENGGLGARRIILRQRANRLEQPGAERVVQIFRGDEGIRRQQAGSSSARTVLIWCSGQGKIAWDAPEAGRFGWIDIGIRS